MGTWVDSTNLDGVWDVEAGALGVADVKALAGAAGVQQISQLLVVDLQQLHAHAVLRLCSISNPLVMCSPMCSHPVPPYPIPSKTVC